MTKVLAVIIGISSVAAALYAGVWVELVGGIRQASDGFNSTPHDSTAIAVGIARAVTFEAVVALMVFFGVGLAALVWAVGEER
jgi:hypothetical protein